MVTNWGASCRRRWPNERRSRSPVSPDKPRPGSSWADGTNWSDAAATQRVYEYAVEPAVLQNLPDRALLLATPSPAGPQLRAAGRDPIAGSVG